MNPLSQAANKPSQRLRIVVPQRQVNGGFDLKFESDPYNMNLRGLLTEAEYTKLIDRLNDYIKPARATSLDAGLLATGMLMVPLALWGVRHKHQTRKRKRLLQDFIYEFNAHHRSLIMRWHRKPISALTIEPKTDREVPEEAYEDVIVEETIPLEENLPYASTQPAPAPSMQQIDLLS